MGVSPTLGFCLWHVERGILATLRHQGIDLSGAACGPQADAKATATITPHTAQSVSGSQLGIRIADCGLCKLVTRTTAVWLQCILFKDAIRTQSKH